MWRMFHGGVLKSKTLPRSVRARNTYTPHSSCWLGWLLCPAPSENKLGVEADDYMILGRTRDPQSSHAHAEQTLCAPKQSKTNRCVLAAQSSPLRAMFEGSFKEGSENVIALLDVEPSSFSLLLDFLYGRSIDVNDENVEALLDLSARYGVSLLRRHCCAFMAGSANPSKACSLLAVADRYDCHRLRRELLAYTLEVRFPFCVRVCARMCVWVWAWLLACCAWDLVFSVFVGNRIGPLLGGREGAIGTGVRTTADLWVHNVKLLYVPICTNLLCSCLP